MRRQREEVGEENAGTGHANDNDQTEQDIDETAEGSSRHNDGDSEHIQYQLLYLDDVVLDVVVMEAMDEVVLSQLQQSDEGRMEIRLKKVTVVMMST